MPGRTGLLLVAVLLLAGCYRMRGSSGGGQTAFDPPRRIDPADVALPEGYRIDVVATGFTFPTGVAFDDSGTPYVLEAGYSYGPVVTTPRLIRIGPDGEKTEVASGDNPPWNGVVYHDGAFYVAGGHLKGGQILRIAPDGAVESLIDGLPSFGDHHTNGPAVGSDGYLYFGQGTATNSGVVGVDNYDYGWLDDHPDFHDIPCETVILAGLNFRTLDPLTPDEEDRVETGAFVPFGTPTQEGQRVEGAIPCSGAILRLLPSGGDVELVAWGFRNPFGLAFSPDGQLYVTENGYDDRGSRPAWGTGDYLWRVTPGAWYGWPDYAGGVPVSEFGPPGREPPAPLLADNPGEPPRPLALLGVHSSSNGIDFSRSEAFGYAGHAFIAQFGDMAPQVGKVLSPVGFQVVRVDTDEGIVHGFAANRGSKVGPASYLDSGGFERPVSVRFSPDGLSLYVVDFGVMTMSPRGPVPHPETGVLWRIQKVER